MVNVRWRHYCVTWQVQRPHQVMNVDKWVEFGHVFWLDDVAADPHNPEVKKVKNTLLFCCIVSFHVLKQHESMSLFLDDVRHVSQLKVGDLE